MIVKQLEKNTNNNLFTIKESRSIYGRRQKYLDKTAKNKHGGSIEFYKIGDRRRGKKIWTYFYRQEEENWLWGIDRDRGFAEQFVWSEWV